LILDRYGDYVVLQALTLHIDQNKEMIATLLADMLQEMGMSIKGVYERSDVDVREKEGLKPERGPLWGKEPPQHIPMSQEEFIRLVDVRNGHKTGYYLDQLENQEYLALFMDLLDLSEPSTRLLNLFSYTGGFGLATRAYVVNVDSSQQVLQLAEQNYDLVRFPKKRVEFVQADAFDYLHRCVSEHTEFDVIVLDPPKFAHSKQQVDRAARGYKDLNLNAFRIIKPGGYMMTFSCSGAIDPDLFQKIVFGALADSGRQAQIIRQLGPSDDHPVALTFPEGAYLKGLLVRVF
jgi:23S rRNA (cytosine1962-C5)-methyltransferase